MRKIAGLTAAVLSSFLFGVSHAFAACDEDEIVIKFSHVVAAEGHPKGEMASALADRVNAEMNGTACMQVFPSSQLFDDNQVMEALLLGDVQLAAPSLSKFEAYTLKYRVFDLPFVFSNMDAVTAFTDGKKGQELLGAMSDYGFVGLGYLFNGLKQFSANRPLIVPDDAKSLRFRVQPSDVAVAMVEAMGGTAQKLAFKDVFEALQMGVVDGQENTWSNIYTQRFFEVQDGATETNHQLLAYLAVTSQEWLNSLDEDVRNQFMTIFTEVSDDFNARSNAINEDSKQSIIENGGVVRALTPDQRDEWVTTMKPVWDMFRDDIGADVIDAAIASNKAR